VHSFNCTLNALFPSGFRKELSFETKQFKASASEVWAFPAGGLTSRRLFTSSWAPVSLGLWLGFTHEFSTRLQSSPRTELEGVRYDRAAGTKLSRVRIPAKASGLVNVLALQLGPLFDNFVDAHPTAEVSEN
jgi:hypothetical protein